MKIDDGKLIDLLMKISDLYDRLEDTQKKLTVSEKDAMNWFHRWQELTEKKEEAKDDGGDNA